MSLFKRSLILSKRNFNNIKSVFDMLSENVMEGNLLRKENSNEKCY